MALATPLAAAKLRLPGDDASEPLRPLASGCTQRAWSASPRGDMAAGPSRAALESGTMAMWLSRLVFLLFVAILLSPHGGGRQ